MGTTRFSSRAEARVDSLAAFVITSFVTKSFFTAVASPEFERLVSRSLPRPGDGREVSSRPTVVAEEHPCRHTNERVNGGFTHLSGPGRLCGVILQTQPTCSLASATLANT